MPTPVTAGIIPHSVHELTSSWAKTGKKRRGKGGQILSSQNENPWRLQGGTMYPFSKLNISLFGSARQTPASSSKNGITQIWEISPRNHITVLPCNYNLISCQNLLRMIQLVTPETEGKQEQVKCWEKQMEARSRWKGNEGTGSVIDESLPSTQQER